MHQDWPLSKVCLKQSAKFIETYLLPNCPLLCSCNLFLACPFILWSRMQVSKSWPSAHEQKAFIKLTTKSYGQWSSFAFFSMFCQICFPHLNPSLSPSCGVEFVPILLVYFHAFMPFVWREFCWCCPHNLLRAAVLLSLKSLSARHHYRKVNNVPRG